jgi:hypothetical protein
MTTSTEPSPGEFRYAVTVRAKSAEQADRVLAERLGHDEDYGFEYTIVDFGRPAATTTAGVLGWPEVTIPEEVWEESGDADPSSRLSASLVVNRVPLHLEARAVKLDEKSGVQSAADEWPADVDEHLTAIANPDGPFLTWAVGGREYVLLAFPFC